ncbi:MAG: dTMP kinase [Pseudomonadota bacterium]
MSQFGRFITLEGIEGMGKSTHLRYLEQLLQAEGFEVLLTREPGGTPMAERLREVLLAPREEHVHAETELLMLMAGRIQHVREIIEPALARGCWVLCDRFQDASYAYQGGGRGLNPQDIDWLVRWANIPKPDQTLLFTAPVSVGMSRIQGRPADRIEAQRAEFFERAQAVYLARAEAEPHRICILDATAPIDAVQSQLKSWLTEYWGRAAC